MLWRLNRRPHDFPHPNRFVGHGRNVYGLGLLRQQLQLDSGAVRDRSEASWRSTLRT